MSNSNDGWGCREISWLAGAIIGVVAAIILGVGAEWNWLLSILAGIVVAAIAALILAYFFCGEISSAAGDDAPTSSVAPSAAPAAAPVADVAPAADPVVKPSAKLAGEEELAAQKGEWRYEGEAETEADAAEPAAPAETASETSGPVIQPTKRLAGQEELAAQKGQWRYEAPADDTSAAPAKEAAPAPAPAAEPAAAASTEGGVKPTGLDAPRGGQVDDLKTIEGIGPKLEELCNNLGIYHFDQIANWGADDVAWMDSNLPRFKGRVTRDKWVNQAKIIVEQGIEVFKERAKTNDY